MLLAIVNAGVVAAATGAPRVASREDVPLPLQHA